MGAIGLSGSKTSQKGTQDTIQSQNQQEQSSGSGSYSNRPVFDPQAQGTIDALGGAFGNLGRDAASSSDFLKGMLQPGGMNPYAQQVVDTQNKLAQPEFEKRLAGVRSGGYGGGVGRDLIDQGMFASDFTNKQSAWNANTLLDAWNADRGMQLSAAGQLGDLDYGRLQGALEYINSLRGQAGEQAQQASGTTTSQGKSNTKSSGTSSNFGGNLSLGAGGSILAPKG